MVTGMNKNNWGFKLYYGLYVIAGLAFFAYLIGELPSGHWRDIILFICLVVIADSVQISLPRGGASIYASSPIDLAGIVLFGPAVMAVVEAVATVITEGLLQRRPVKKVLFNVPLLVLTVGMSSPRFDIQPDLVLGNTIVIQTTYQGAQSVPDVQRVGCNDLLHEHVGVCRRINS